MPRRNKTPPHIPFKAKSGHSGKQRFASKSTIEALIKEKQRENPDLTLHAYRCPECSGWHLTSRPSKNDIVD